MECIPAIDIRGGRCVRLLRGDFDAETFYGDPIEQAESYVADGATRIHVVDLDAARGEGEDNVAIVASIVRAVAVPVQVGGGIRDKERALALFDGGADRIVLGSAAVEDPELVKSLAKSHPEQVAVGLDHRQLGARRREVALHGWSKASGLSLSDVLEGYGDVPLAAVVVTDISRDGTLAGPDLEGLSETLGGTSLPVIASGGVGTPFHLASLARLTEANRYLAGVIVGRALLSGAMSLKEAIAACKA